jgi:uncharacterized membrane protein YfcA
MLPGLVAGFLLAHAIDARAFQVAFGALLLVVTAILALGKRAAPAKLDPDGSTVAPASPAPSRGWSRRLVDAYGEEHRYQVSVGFLLPDDPRGCERPT